MRKVFYVYIAFFCFFMFYSVHLFLVCNANYNGSFEDIWHLMLFYFIELGALFCLFIAFMIFDKANFLSLKREHLLREITLSS